MSIDDRHKIKYRKATNSDTKNSNYELGCGRGGGVEACEVNAHLSW